MIFLHRARWLRDSPFTKVIVGASGGQLAMAASLPLLARLYDPQAIGTFAVTLVWCQWVSIAASARIERSLPKHESHDQGTIVRLSPVLATASGVIAGGLIALNYGPSFWVVSSLALGMVLSNTAVYAALAKRDYRVVSRIRATSGLAIAAFQVGGGFFSPTTDVLVGAYAAGTLLATAVGGRPLIALARQPGPWLPRREVRGSLWRFGLTVGSSTLLTNIALGLPLIIVDSLYGAVGAASFFMARRILAVPSQFLSRSLSEVSYAEVVCLSPADRHRCIARWSRIAVRACLPLLAVGIALVVAMRLLVGDEYPGITQIAAVLLIPSVVQAIGTSFSQVLYALDQEIWLLRWSLSRVVAIVAVFGVLVLFNLPLTVAVVMLSSVGVVAYWNLMRQALTSAREAAEQ